MATESVSNRFRFTKRDIEAIPAGDQRRHFYDTVTRRLCLRVRKRRVFYWYGKIDGRPKMLKLGAFPDLTIENARKMAERASGRMAEGLPPLEAPSERGKTLGELFELYLEVHARPRKRSWQHDEYVFKRYLADWANRPISEIGKAELQRFHAELGTQIGTTTANRVRALLSSMWNVARDHGHWEHENPLKAVKKFSEQDRERYLRADELPKFFTELQADPNQDYADYVRLSLFTGGRQSNVLAMRWENINLNRAEWTIPGNQFKSGRGQIIPLTNEALQVLAKRKGQADSPFVFPGRGTTGHLTRPGKWWERLLERCGFSEKLTMHDLRRTLGSWQAAGGASLLVIGKTLGHQDHRSTQVYSRLDTDPVRESLTSVTRAIASAGNTDDEDRVKSLLQDIPRDTDNRHDDLRKALKWYHAAYYEVFQNPARQPNESLTRLAYYLGQAEWELRDFMDEAVIGRKKSEATRDERAIEAAAKSRELEAAGDRDFIDRVADEYNVSPRTIHRWREIPIPSYYPPK